MQLNFGPSYNWNIWTCMGSIMKTFEERVKFHVILGKKNDNLFIGTLDPD